MIAEHRLDFIADLVTRALLVENGRIVRSMTAEELLALSPEELETLGLRDPDRSRTDSVKEILRKARPQIAARRVFRCAIDRTA